MKLPSADIVVVHRSDGSGTTFIWTDYLSKVSADWKSKVGSNTAVEWPMGIGAKGNEGVANNVQQAKGSIGYVEYAYAKQNKLAHTKLINKDGKTVEPSLESFQAAAANADWASAPGFGVILTEQPGAATWPVTSATFILMHKKAAKADDFASAARSSSTGPTPLAARPRPSWITFLCQRKWSNRSRSPGPISPSTESLFSRASKAKCTDFAGGPGLARRRVMDAARRPRQSCANDAAPIFLALSVCFRNESDSVQWLKRFGEMAWTHGSGAQGESEERVRKRAQALRHFRYGDKGFSFITWLAAVTVLVLLGGVFVSLIIGAAPAFKTFGFGVFHQPGMEPGHR